jgi:glycosyltransferase involved in cell wall biosynthesis
MKIGFDISQTGRSKAGCGQFADALIKQLAKRDAQNEYILYPTFGDSFWDTAWSSDTCRFANSNFRRAAGHASLEEAKAFWLPSSQHLEGELGDPDIVHSNNFYCPVGLKRARLVYTLYDLAFLEHPEWTTEANRVACFTGVFNASLYADKIVAISDHSRRHFLEVFPHFPAQRIDVIYPGSRFAGHPEEERPDELPDLVENEYWLHVGTLEPRKNQKRLLSSYARLKARQGGAAFPLVLAGAPGWLLEDFEAVLADLGLQESVIRLGYASDSALQWLYQKCYAFLYPSLFEGFGLPVLEAMTLGAPVISSNTTSIPEIVGDAALLIDPFDDDQLFDAMLALASDPCRRNELALKGTQRSKLFSWDRAAGEVLTVYRALHEIPR